MMTLGDQQVSCGLRRYHGGRAMHGNEDVHQALVSIYEPELRWLKRNSSGKTPVLTTIISRTCFLHTECSIVTGFFEESGRHDVVQCAAFFTANRKSTNSCHSM